MQKSNPIVLSSLVKTFPNGLVALDGVNLEIQEGEIFALLGPNGAGKTTLINIICGLSTKTSGDVKVDGLDIERHFREVRQLIGLVPQELYTDMFETVWDTVCFSRGLFGLPKDSPLVEKILNDLSLWSKRQEIMKNLSGGMKRRVLIAKALAHEPRILFLDEPTAGVDVELRQDMWELIRSYKKQKVTIILTTHFIDEAETLADRVGVINQGKLILVEDKISLMTKLGKKTLVIYLEERINKTANVISRFNLDVKNDGLELEYTFDENEEGTAISDLIRALAAEGIHFKTLETKKSSLEEIFLDLVVKKK
ncbi:MAG: multidrug ABC transporter ATP-binding protein [Proteobacteria bacterium]|nr:multidrug ABC transporter ATP-binding protein [Pseudomonadota bacterium]